ncbi:restriction endonuclease [Blautia marasmi]|uniref:restriction endonuclease n=1 Tax=Blautia marasmi TaxID=1917868 RepID=UPI000CF2B4D6|nr:restriction endonuclease [Blautia marasmi]
MNNMDLDTNPYRKMAVDITPSQFELICRDTLAAYAEKEQLQGFLITHDKKIEADDGTYQIDLYSEFSAMGAKFKVIVECKRYKRPVEREKVAALYAKVTSIGANKGILISTSGFQSGATMYAEKHGITLIQIVHAGIQYITNSATRLDPLIIQMQHEMQSRLPEYISLLWSVKDDYPYDQVYPTESMIQSVRKTVMKLLKKEDA